MSDFAEELHRARLKKAVIAPLRNRSTLGIDDAYAISLDLLRRREAAGERLIGKKIGVTSKAVQEMLGVHEPDFGFLTDAMQVADGATVRIAETLIQPRAEAEIALILGSALSGPGVTSQDVLAATEALVPCIEIVDSRIDGWDIGMVDTIADNASCGVFVLGAGRIDPKSVELPALGCRLFKNGCEISRGTGAAVMGSPLASVAWLANTLGRYGVSLAAGDVILSGSLVPLAPVEAGDEVRAEFDRLGSAGICFA